LWAYRAKLTGRRRVALVPLCSLIRQRRLQALVTRCRCCGRIIRTRTIPIRAQRSPAVPRSEVFCSASIASQLTPMFSSDGATTRPAGDLPIFAAGILWDFFCGRAWLVCKSCRSGCDRIVVVRVELMPRITRAHAWRAWRPWLPRSRLYKAVILAAEYTAIFSRMLTTAAEHLPGQRADYRRRRSRLQATLPRGAWGRDFRLRHEAAQRKVLSWATCLWKLPIEAKDRPGGACYGHGRRRMLSARHDDLTWHAVGERRTDHGCSNSRKKAPLPGHPKRWWHAFTGFSVIVDLHGAWAALANERVQRRGRTRVHHHRKIIVASTVCSHPWQFRMYARHCRIVICMGRRKTAI